MKKAIVLLSVFLITHYVCFPETYTDILAKMSKEILEEINPSQEKTLAITGFKLNDNELGITTLSIDTLTEQFLASKRIRIIERSNISTITKEQELQLSGFIDENSAVGIGKILGAQYLCFGTITIIEQQLRITIKVVNVETGELLSIKSGCTELTNEIKSLLQNKYNQTAAKPTITNPEVVSINTQSSKPLSDTNTNNIRVDEIDAKSLLRNLNNNIFSINITSTESVLYHNYHDRKDYQSIQVKYHISTNYDAISAFITQFQKIIQQDKKTGNHKLFIKYYESKYNLSEKTDYWKVSDDLYYLCNGTLATWMITFDWLDSDNNIISSSEQTPKNISIGFEYGDYSKMNLCKKPEYDFSFIFPISSNNAIKQSKVVRIKSIALQKDNNSTQEIIYELTE